MKTSELTTRAIDHGDSLVITGITIVGKQYRLRLNNTSDRLILEFEAEGNAKRRPGSHVPGKEVDADFIITIWEGAFAARRKLIPPLCVGGGSTPGGVRVDAPQTDPAPQPVVTFKRYQPAGRYHNSEWQQAYVVTTAGINEPGDIVWCEHAPYRALELVVPFGAV